MSVDLYQPCPCGGGKKIKFCCCQDIAQDLDKIIRALEGEQRAAALDQIGRLLASKGERAALLALKGEVQIQLGNLDDAKVTVDKFLELNPDNQVALALSSILESDNTAAITKLQRAIEQIDKDIPFAVYDALVVVGQALLSSGDILAAKRHLAVQATLSRNSDKRALELLMQIHSSPRIPLLMKQDIKIAERPSDVPWADAFDEAINNVSRGAWLRATEQLVALANDAPNEPAILKNIALFRGWLGDADATATAWHRYAQLENVSLDDAVEGEALGQLLDQDAESDTIDVVTVTYPLEDNERLKECLLSDRHVSQMPVDLGQLGDGDEPPPNAAFWLLDRPLPTTGTEIARDAIPHVLGELYLFGRQTDRQARLEFSVTQDDAFDSTTAKLSEVAGDLIGDPESEEVTGDVSMTSAALTWNWRFPDDTPTALRSKLIGEQRTEVMFSKWPNTPVPALDGKMPNEVAGDPKFRVRLLAAILLLELAGNNQDLPVMDFNELRGKLNLATRDPIDPETVAAKDLSLVQLELVIADKLADDDLIEAFQRAGAMSALAALRPLALEISQREQLSDKVDMVQVHRILSGLSKDNEESFNHIRTARQLAVAKGESPAQFLLAELQLRLERGEPDGCNAIIEDLRTRHFEEPGVGEGLYNILVSFGIISPDGEPAGPEPESESAIIAAGESSATGGELWTPDSEKAASGGEQKSQLWVPGMD